MLSFWRHAVFCCRAMMANKTRYEETIRHEPSDECYVDEFRRRCPRCSDPKELFCFRPDDDKPRLALEITPFCNVCRAEIKEADRKNDRELKTAAALTKNSEAVSELGKLLNNVGKRRAIQEACPSLIDGINQVMEKAGGTKAFWDLAGEGLIKSLQSESPEIRLKAVNTAIGFVRDGNKMQGEPVDLSSISDDDLVMLLRPSAKQFLLENAEFRKELLNDPEVRRMFQSDMGIEVLEVQPDGADGGAA